MQWGNKILFDRGSKGMIVTLHGEGYTERHIAAKLRATVLFYA